MVNKITTEAGRKVFAFSDIHSDLDALIVLVRDCAGVVKKKESSPEFDVSKRDTDLDKEYSVDGDKSLGYEWCGGNAIVVIVGDILDGARHSEKNITEPIVCKSGHFQDLVEVKILDFLFEMSKKASKIDKDAGFHIVIGNHEWYNMIMAYDGNGNWCLPYICRDEQYNTIYKVERKAFFSTEKGIEKLRLQHLKRLYIVLQIDDNVFVHGQLPPLDKLRSDSDWEMIISDINTELQDGKSFAIINKKIPIVSEMLWRREWGAPDKDDHELDGTEKKTKRKVDEEAFCQNVNQILALMFQGKAIRCFIGHSIQSEVYYKPEQIKTFDTKVEDERKYLEIYSDQAVTTQVAGDKTHWIAITLECTVPKTKKAQIIKLDVGVSRAQDMILEKDYIPYQHYYLQPRCPQLVHFLTHGDEMYVVRASLEHTMTHIIRESNVG